MAIVVGGITTVAFCGAWGYRLVYRYRAQRLADARRRAAAVGKVCSFCGMCEEEVRGLVPGVVPGVPIKICNECIHLCDDIIAEECEQEEALPSADDASEEEHGWDRVACSFCGKTGAEVRKLIAGPEERYL